MKAEVEVYKGIEFVRLSSLPAHQAQAIKDSSYASKTIKILRDTDLISDCLPYSTYSEWFAGFSSTPLETQITEYKLPKNVRLRFAFK